MVSATQRSGPAGDQVAIRFNRNRDASRCLKFEIVRHVTRLCDDMILTSWILIWIR